MRQITHGLLRFMSLKVRMNSWFAERLVITSKTNNGGIIFYHIFAFLFFHFRLSFRILQNHNKTGRTNCTKNPKVKECGEWRKVDHSQSSDSTKFKDSTLQWRYLKLTSRIVNVCDIIWMFICDWLVGRWSLECGLVSCLLPLTTLRLFTVISVLMNILDMACELNLRMLNAVFRSLEGDTGICLQNFGIAFSMSARSESSLHSDVPLLVCWWKSMMIAIATR